MERAAGLARFFQGARAWTKQDAADVESLRRLQDADTFSGAIQYCAIDAGEVSTDDDNILISQQPLSRIN